MDYCQNSRNSFHKKLSLSVKKTFRDILGIFCHIFKGTFGEWEIFQPEIKFQQNQTDETLILLKT